jgi:drug/metabolite transporter (DMT)-like permease
LFLLAGGWRELAALSPVGWVYILYLGILCSGLSLVLWQAAMERMGANEVSALLYLEPLVTQALAWAMLGEPVTAAALSGGAAILLGVYLVSRSSPVAPTEPVPAG